MSAPTRIGPDGRLAASEHVRCKRFDDDLVMVDLQGGEYFALDAVGARMWDLLIAGKTPAAVAAALTAEYEASEDEMLRDCTTLANELLKRGLLIVLPS
jgi:hypothetical protein